MCGHYIIEEPKLPTSGDHHIRSIVTQEAQQQAHNGRFLLVALEPMTCAPCGHRQKALQLHQDNGMRWRRGSKKRFLRCSILLWQLFENWNVSIFCGLIFLSTDPNSSKDGILYKIYLPEGQCRLLTDCSWPKAVHENTGVWFWTFLTLIQYSFLLLYFPKSLGCLL